MWTPGLAFVLARRARQWVLRRFSSVHRHTQIDRLIHPQHRLTSLIMLRMTFPVDVLSYALGLFSRSTSGADVALSTALGAAPFALMFALVPTLSGVAQLVIAVASVAVFGLYVVWVLRASRPSR